MTYFSGNQTKRALVLICLIVLLFVQVRAQLVASISTDKPVYLYGETITLVGTVTNQADTAVTVILPSQGPVTSASFDDVRLFWILAPLSLPFVFLPHMSYKSVLEIDGSRLGLPNKEGRHSLACSFSFLLNGSLFYRNDSTLISQPLFYGGQLLVEYSVHTPPSQIQSLRDSMNAIVISSNTYSETVVARCQSSGFILDSLVGKYIGDSRLTGIAVDRSISPPRSVVTSIASSFSRLAAYCLSENYPNPFNPSTTITYSLSKMAYASLKIFNTLGQEVAVLVNEQKGPGYYQATWNANVPSGVYFCRLQAGEFVETKKMVLLK